MIQCPVCLKFYKIINNSHLKSHGLKTINDLLVLYPKFDIQLNLKLKSNSGKINIVKSRKVKNQFKSNNIENYMMNPKLCKQCNKIIHYFYHKIRIFCSSSCAATYNNQHKQHGTRRSKLEVYIESQLVKDFPQLVFLFNDKTAISSELDIYCPQLKLAIEINGILHYEPIYNRDLLTRIQNNDNQKTVKCYEQGIELAVIDTSQHNYCTQKSNDKYYQIIKNLITQVLPRLSLSKNFKL